MTVGQPKLSRGTTFVVAAMVVELPILDRPIALPLLFRLWRPSGPTKPALACDMIRLTAHARRDRIAAQYRADLPGEATPEQIHTIRLARANTTA